MNSGISETVLREIRDSAVRNDLRRVVLFGSRARGDYKSRSDIDLAVSGGNVPQFWSDMDDASTLISFDIVNLDKPVQQALLDSILREGYSIYEKGENFFAALRNLEGIRNYKEPYNVIELTGMVALYAICFEQAWKAMKELLEDSGVDEALTGSPKAVLRAAWKAGLIDDDHKWLAALQARNNASHAYNREIALSVLEETRNVYLELFRKLKHTMEQNWLNEYSCMLNSL